MTLPLGVHVRIFVCVVFMGVLVGVVFNAKADITENEYIDAVKNGYVTNATHVKVSDAFNRYFEEPYWRYYEAKTGQHVVELSGNAVATGDEGYAIVQFVVDDNLETFSVGAMKFNDVVFEKEEKWQFVDQVYKNWQDSHLAKQK
ncbi:MAG: hypothetical protein RR595_14830 [Lysinibacillus sp.]